MNRLFHNTVLASGGLDSAGGLAEGSGTSGSAAGRKRQWSGGRAHKRVAREIPTTVDELKKALEEAYIDLDEALEKLEVIGSIVKS